MTTKAPRQREGQEFPGGKALRKRMAKLKARREASRDGLRYNHRTPGSMK